MGSTGENVGYNMMWYNKLGQRTIFGGMKKAEVEYMTLCMMHVMR